VDTKAAEIYANKERPGGASTLNIRVSLTQCTDEYPSYLTRLILGGAEWSTDWDCNGYLIVISFSGSAYFMMLPLLAVTVVPTIVSGQSMQTLANANPAPLSQPTSDLILSLLSCMPLICFSISLLPTVRQGSPNLIL
jgi:hypothetical protein